MRGWSSRKWAGALVSALALVWLGAGLAVADEGGCEDICGAGRRSCEMALRAAYTGCKHVCRESETRRDCRRACSESFELARDECDAGREECTLVCEAPVDPAAAVPGQEPLPGGPPVPGAGEGSTGPGLCVSDCRDSLKGCVEEVLDLGHQCVDACFEAQRAAVAECLTLERPGRCLAHLASEAGACLGECAEGWHGAGEGCRDMLQVCRETCGSPVDLPGEDEGDANDESDDDGEHDDGEHDDGEHDDGEHDDHGSGGYGSAHRAFMQPVSSLLD